MLEEVFLSQEQADVLAVKSGFRGESEKEINEELETNKSI